jgi:hypothetical protein
VLLEIAADDMGGFDEAKRWHRCVSRWADLTERWLYRGGAMPLLTVHTTSLTRVAIRGLMAVVIGTAACGRAEEDGPAARQEPSRAAQAASGAPAQNSFDPCTLLTADEVQAALGWKPASTDRVVGQIKGTGVCKYTSEKGTMARVPEQLRVGITVCPTNMPCTSLPDFASSEEMLAFRKKGYEGQTGGAFSGMKETSSRSRGWEFR